ncbi:MAG: RNA polymerase sigma factor SigJ [Myxococcota bacterium]
MQSEAPSSSSPGPPALGSSALHASTFREFEALRSRLMGIAYRMLGSVADAEDVLQEAYLRWHETEHGSIQNGEAWLVAVTTRLSIDRARRATTERARYAGPWLPTPIATEEGSNPGWNVERSDRLSVAFLLMLEQLSAVERAVFVLREVFEYDYVLIASAIGKSEAATRQLLHRARERVHAAEQRADKAVIGPLGSQREAMRGLLQRFLTALEHGDRDSMLALLSPDVKLTSDGGGKVSAARKTVVGADRVVRLFLGLRNKHVFAREYRLVELNGAPAWLSSLDGSTFASTIVQCDGQHITAFYRVLNPDKLASLRRSVCGGGTRRPPLPK